MKDIVITPRAVRREFLILLLCFVVAILLNVFAIATRGTSWSELLSQWHIMLALSVVLYVLLGIIRLVVCGIIRLFKRR